ncbi:MAG: hypothetical protein V1495_06955 [Pseudomonadota bacterium]
MKGKKPYPGNMGRELRDKADLFEPLKITILEVEPRDNRSRRLDARVQLTWNNKTRDFVAEMKATSAPKVVQEGIRALKQATSADENRLVVVPYLSWANADVIRSEGVSALDLNGNYYIQTPDLVAIRLDQPNQYKQAQPIKAAYSGNSSMVGRLFLMENKTYGSVQEVFRAIETLGGRGGAKPIVMSTVSKVLKRLEEDLIIEKSRKKIRLLQAGKLLDNLRDSYKPPTLTDNELNLRLPEGKKPWGLGFTGIYAFTGESSVQMYATTTEPQVYSMYVADIPYLLRRSDIRKYEDARFPNLILKETRDAFVYFRDERSDSAWASAVQTYLELSQLGKREKEIAEDVRKGILEPFL